LEVVKFVVDETPYACWDWELKRKNLKFLEGIDADYFRYVAEANVANLGGANRHRAALSLRLAYSQGLETLFALLCSMVQAPQCAIGWMLVYRNDELQKVVQKITSGYTVFSRIKEGPVTWALLAKYVHSCLSHPSEKTAWIQEGFGRLWGRFAGEFTNPKTVQEYNSAKHGLRTSLGGFSLAFGLEESPGVPVHRDKLQSLGGSDFGTSYFAVERMVDDERLNFRPRSCSRNWNPEQLAEGLVLLSMSVNNVISFLRITNGMSAPSCKFLNPSNSDAFDFGHHRSVGVTDFNVDAVIRQSDIQPCTREEVIDSYALTRESSS